jgi:hypothetical protein
MPSEPSDDTSYVNMVSQQTAAPSKLEASGPSGSLKTLPATASQTASDPRPSKAQHDPLDAVPNAKLLANRPMVPTSAADWDAKKEIIRELYMNQNMILNEVIDIMITKHKFKAT